MYRKLLFCLFLTFSFFQNYLAWGQQSAHRGKTNILSKIVPYLDTRAAGAMNHSIVLSTRGRSDCMPSCPSVDVWQYQYKEGDEVIVSDKPISTLEKFWKHPDEARIVALTLFGSGQKYLDGILDFLDSTRRIKEVNKIPSDTYAGYESFTFRVYVAKRNPSHSNIPLKNATADEFVKVLLNKGCEIAYVDNHLEKVGLDGTFWRFMAAAENMEEGKRIRYLVRDVDWKLTTPEVYSVGRWIESKMQFHRFHPFPICMGPLTAGLWGGTHVGKPVITDMKTRIEYYPYRLMYGDDEMFLRDMVFPLIKYTGSVLTHSYAKGFKHRIANPYRGSCEQPTQEYCLYLNPSAKCKDEIIDYKIFPYPVTDIGYDFRLSSMDDRYFLFPKGHDELEEARSHLLFRKN